MRPIEYLIRDEHISEVMVNAPSHVSVEQDGKISEVRGVTTGEKSLQVAVRNIARALGGEPSHVVKIEK